MIDMDNKIELTRFLDAQNMLYLKALSEIKDGLKQSHWMWFIFPQLQGLGPAKQRNSTQSITLMKLSHTSHIRFLANTW